MSKASDNLEAETEGGVPTADEVIAATGTEASEVVQRTRAQLEAGIRSDPLRSVAIAAGAGFLAAVVLRRL
jgi:ElaB/YqjD/DUF883 family membrane-anchored ribosome-binding protein